jgi:hypothetical protein
MSSYLFPLHPMCLIFGASVFVHRAVYSALLDALGFTQPLVTLIRIMNYKAFVVRIEQSYRHCLSSVEFM